MFTRRGLIAGLAVVHWVSGFCAAAPACAGSLDVPNHRWGVSFGNSRDFNGLRLNWRDSDVGMINGLNLTFWTPRENPYAHYRGLALGLVGTGAQQIDGVSVGLMGTGAQRINGLTLGGLGAGADRIEGVILGGLGAGGKEVKGLAVGGLGVGAGDHLKGIAVGGLGAGSGGDVRGIGVGGIGVGAGRNLTGLGIGGIGVGAGQDLTGLGIGGIGVGCGDDLRGVAIGGVGVGCGGRFSGIGVGGIGVGASELVGLHLAGAYLRADEFDGVGAAAYCRVLERLDGVTLAVFNWTRELHGVQIGLLNYAGNNRRGLKLLPVINAHLN